MKEYRCKCGKLLFKYAKNADIQLEEDVEVKTGIVSALETKCPKCKNINKIDFTINVKNWRYAVGSSK